jgi:adenylate cyclase
MIGNSSPTSGPLRVLAKALTVGTAGFDADVRRRVRLYRPEDHDHMVDGLRKAGWGE